MSRKIINVARYQAKHTVHGVKQRKIHENSYLLSEHFKLAVLLYETVTLAYECDS